MAASNLGGTQTRLSVFLLNSTIIARGSASDSCALRFLCTYLCKRAQSREQHASSRRPLECLGERPHCEARPPTMTSLLQPLWGARARAGGHAHTHTHSDRPPPHCATPHIAEPTWTPASAPSRPLPELTEPPRRGGGVVSVRTRTGENGRRLPCVTAVSRLVNAAAS